MLILSQDKTKITENLELRIDNILKETGKFPNINTQIVEYCIVNKKYNTVLGEYNTEERAKEVLQEILERYTNWNNLMYGQPEGLCSPKYEMPEK